MKRNEFVQIKGSDLKELWLKVKDIKGDIAGLTMDKNMNKLKDLKSISKKKKDLAQILTVVRQKELLSELEAKVKPAEPAESVDSPRSRLAGEAGQSVSVSENQQVNKAKVKKVTKKVKVAKEKK